MVDARRLLIKTSNKINVAGTEWKSQRTKIIWWEEKGSKIMSVRQYSSGCHRKKGEMEFKKGNAIRPHII